MLRTARLNASFCSKLRNLISSTNKPSAVFAQQRMYTDGGTNDEVVLETVNNVGTVLLNRPKALNALNLPMIREIYPKFKKWDEDSNVQLIIMKGAGNKAFCAGGDVRAIAEAGKRGEDLTKTFFKEEYMLNYQIGTLKTPFVGIIDGITMGGGVGLSVHGKYRVATEKTIFAMPETAIGFFPDVGGGYFLPRLQGSLGCYLALTGHRLRGVDVYFAGVATHFVHTELIPKLENQLLKCDTGDVKEILSDFHSKSIEANETFSLTPSLETINDIFSASSVHDIFEKLEKNQSDWAKKQLKIMKAMSPTSMCVTFEQLKRGKELSLGNLLAMEYRMSQKFMEGVDFYEGIRSVLVDKDNKPVWSPASVDDVDPDDVSKYFLHLPPEEELVL